MSASLSPATVRLAATAQLFATVEFSHSSKPLPLQPLARFVAWDPIGVFGYPRRIVVLTATGEEVQSWAAAGTFWEHTWMYAWDAITVEFGTSGPLA